ncbi:hypothetical protein [Rhodohalobacter halophilus]|uniref:hypothetical protein n=1 Tax=Rhodohalobacter halophilus TaxID=1812810 RepID=UPI00083F7964|nr:hypothetical protein [Rhodohalobacter halophilus]
MIYKKALGLFIISLLPLIGAAQNQQNVSINVSATVAGTVEMITINTVDFENIEREGSVVRVDPIFGERAGKMIARGTPNAEFRVDYIRERELVNLDGDGIIFFNYEVAGNRIDDQETSELLDQDIRDLQFNDDGEYYFWIGGSVDLSDINPGSYQGEFTIEIEYI